MRNKSRLLKYTLLLGASAIAVPPDYAPLASPSPFRQMALRELPGNDREELRVFSSEGPVQILVSVDEAERLRLEVISAGQFKCDLSLPVGMRDFTEAYAADLNQDGVDDYILVVPTGGCGLNADCSFVVFFLSTGTGFTGAVTASYAVRAEDFIVVEGWTRFIHASFSGIVPCIDRKDHSFWVYNLLAFNNGDVEIDNSGASMFPKIVWYSHATNHQETILLSPKQKADLIRRTQSTWREELD